MLKVKLSNGEYALIDEESKPLLTGSWYKTQNGYAVQKYWDSETRTRRSRRMHRVVNNTPNGYYTDHINGNKLDNRRCNLRTVTLAENQLNRRLNKNNKFGYPGISLEPNGKYRARIQLKGKKINLGNFSNLQAAKSALTSKRKELGFYA